MHKVKACSVSTINTVDMSFGFLLKETKRGAQVAVKSVAGQEPY